MTCKESIGLICEYLDRRLDPSVERELTRHFDNCKDCRMVLDAARRTLEVYFNRKPERLPLAKQKIA